MHPTLHELDRRDLPTSDLELHLKACKNARQLSRICDLLEGGGTNEALQELKNHIRDHVLDPQLMALELLEQPIDYDPDIHGWPWETDHAL